jgi:hypothetical protein
MTHDQAKLFENITKNCPALPANKGLRPTGQALATAIEHHAPAFVQAIATSRLRDSFAMLNDIMSEGLKFVEECRANDITENEVQLMSVCAFLANAPLFFSEVKGNA